MNSLAMTRSNPPAVAPFLIRVSPALLARTAGVLYLIIFIVAPSGAATATSPRMLVTLLCDTGAAFVFYALFRPVSRNLAMLALLFRLFFVAIMTLDALNYFGAIDLFHTARSAQVFDTVERLSLVPFGVHCLVIGYLIYRSGFLPRFLGVGMALAGLTYVNFVYPWLVHVAFPYILIPGGVGEGLLTLWLLAAAVDSRRWAENAVAARRPTSASGGNAT